MTKEELSLDNPVHRRRFVKLTGVGLAAGLAGCTGGQPEELDETNEDSSTDGTMSGSGGTDTAGGEDPNVLTVNLGNNLAGTLYGSTNNITEGVTIQNLLYSSLTSRDPHTGEIVPDVAKSMPDISPDGKSFTFDLREDVTFHDGTNLTASDVKYSFDVMHEYNLTNAGSFEFENIVVEDDYRITFETKEAYAPWVDYAARYFSIVREGIAEEVDSFPEDINAGPKNGCNSGPMELVEYRPQNIVHLKKYDDYHEDGVPGVDEIIFKAMPEASAQNIAIRKGNVDVVGIPSPKDFNSLKQQDGIKGGMVPDPSSRIVIYLSHKAPFDNVDLRKAVAYGLPRKSIVEDMLYGHGFASSIPAPPGEWFYNEDADYYGSEPKADKVQEHLEKAGKPDGFEFDMLVSNAPPHPDMALVIQESLKQFGITVNIQKVDAASFYDPIVKQEYVSGLETWTSAPNPDYYLSTQFTDFGKYNGRQRWGEYGDTVAARDEVTELIRESRKYTSRSDRAPYYKEVNQILADTLPYIWIGGTTNADLWRNRVQNYSPNPGSWINLRTVGIE